MIHHLSADRFDEASREALDDGVLRGALAHATGVISERRAGAIAKLPDWEELRERGREIKAETLGSLDRYLATFVRRAEARGVHVHWARDAAEANGHLLALAKRLDAKTIVKSKSMTTEEIGLNDALEEAGFRPVETDLGEWIIQLAGETPSHIIAPAIHKTRDQIADLFAKELSVERTNDPAELTRIARKILRADFASADLGVSGVNFAIAETGSFHVLENEGNGRMTTSLPRVHVAVMGIEKVIPRLADMEVFLRLLPRSGTGQHITSYQSIFSGPVGRLGPDGEGPEEVHLVLLDNGRSKMLKGELPRQSLACIRCGACLNTCPVYKQIGGHAYGSVYPGPIGAVITPQLAGIERAAKLPYASSLCGACREVCPVKIDIPNLLLELRAKRMEEAAPPAEHRAFRAWAWAMADAGRYRWAARIARLFQPAAARGGLFGGIARKLSPPLAGWTKGRKLRPMAKRSFRDRWESEAASMVDPAAMGGERPGADSIDRGAAPTSGAASPTRPDTTAVADAIEAEPFPFVEGAIEREASEAGREILGRIASSLEGERRPTPGRASVSSERVAPGGPAELTSTAEGVDRFVEVLTGVGGQCHRVATFDEAAEVLAGLLTERGATSLALSDDDAVRGIAERAAARAGVEAFDGWDDRERLLEASAGFSTAQHGIAETGSLVLLSNEERHRVVSLVPPVHVALLRTSDMVGTLGDALGRISRATDGGPPPLATIVTGPSRTADIELTLVVGVHGPQELHVLVLDE